MDGYSRRGALYQQCRRKERLQRYHDHRSAMMGCSSERGGERGHSRLRLAFPCSDAWKRCWLSRGGLSAIASYTLTPTEEINRLCAVMCPKSWLSEPKVIVGHPNLLPVDCAKDHKGRRIDRPDMRSFEIEMFTLKSVRAGLNRFRMSAHSGELWCSTDLPTKKAVWMGEIDCWPKFKVTEGM